MMALKFKKYTWPNDPHTYREVLRRQPQYTTSGGETSYSGMGATGRVITASGVFFGETAYEDFEELMELAEDNTAGELFHPQWGSRYCYITGLDMTQEPQGNLIRYSIEFTHARSDGSVPK